MKKYTSILLLLFLIVAFTTCKKEPDAPTGGNKIEMGETNADSVAYYTAKVSTSIIGLGKNEIIQFGHCWSTSAEPTIENDKSISGVFDSITVSSELTGLAANTTYYVHSFVTYKYGTLYGDEEKIKTLATRKPIVTTDEVTDITNSTATCGGINDDGGLTISQRGVCWNTIGNPTLENNIGITNDDSGTGFFTSQLTGLTENTTYYVVAYATNEEGTAYGQTRSFIAAGITDPRDGQIYETVVIGNQTWFAKNLNYETGNSWCYDNNGSNCNEYGRLYEWETATNACPAGWHLPNDEEWKTLEMYLGMSQNEADQISWRGTDEGKKLKSTSGWNNSGNGTDEVGFTALPGGYRYTDGSFYVSGSISYWWSATEYVSAYAWFRSLAYDGGKVRRNYYGKGYGFSVRCVRD